MSANIDIQEVEKFSQQAIYWWDPQGPLKTLHDINPLRLNFIEQSCTLTGKKIVDVGCGGGILNEAMAAKGAEVTGIDRAAELIQTAQLHLHETQLSVNYQCIDLESFSANHPEMFDALTCMELLEHVPDPQAIVQACSQLVKPKGHLFFSTLNRNPKAYALAIVGAEYLLNMLPKGTHDYAKFIKPSELARWGRQAGLILTDQIGLHYNPLMRNYKLDADVSVNYLMHFVKQ